MVPEGPPFQFVFLRFMALAQPMQALSIVPAIEDVNKFGADANRVFPRHVRGAEITATKQSKREDSSICVTFCYRAPDREGFAYLNMLCFALLCHSRSGQHRQQKESFQFSWGTLI